MVVRGAFATVAGSRIRDGYGILTGLHLIVSHRFFRKTEGYHLLLAIESGVVSWYKARQPAVIAGVSGADNGRQFAHTSAQLPGCPWIFQRVGSWDVWRINPYKLEFF